MANSSEENSKREKLSIPREIAKLQLLADATTAEIAEGLGVPIEEYVDQVLKFAMNPELEPELELIDEEELYNIGDDPIDDIALATWVRGLGDGSTKLAEAEEERADGFGASELDRKETILKAFSSESTSTAPVIGNTGEIVVSDDESGNVLKNLLLAQKQRSITTHQTAVRGRRDVRRARGQ